jgi:hypothetical protein
MRRQRRCASYRAERRTHLPSPPRLQSARRRGATARHRSRPARAHATEGRLRARRRPATQYVDEIILGQHHGACDGQTSRQLGVRAHPTHFVAILERQQRAMHAGLRTAVDQRRGMRECTAVPVQRLFDIRAGSRIVEPPTVTLGQQQIEPIGMAVPTTRVAVVQSDEQPAFVATQNTESLRREKIGVKRGWLERGSDSRANNSERQPRSARVSPLAGRFRSTSADERERPVSPRGKAESYSRASIPSSRGSASRAMPSSHDSAKRGCRTLTAYWESRRDGWVRSGSSVRNGATKPA